MHFHGKKSLTNPYIIEIANITKNGIKIASGT